MRLSLLLAVLFTTLGSVTANAADKGFYVGGGIGQANVQVDDVFGSGYDFDEDAFAYKIFGGYKFFPWLSVEGAFIDAGDPEVGSSLGDETVKLNIGVQALVAAAVFALPIADRFELFIKPGFAYWDASTRLTYQTADFRESFKDDDNGTAFFLGGGAAVNADNLSLRLEYEWFEAAPEYDTDLDEFVDELDASAGFISVSVVYSF